MASYEVRYHRRTNIFARGRLVHPRPNAKNHRGDGRDMTKRWPACIAFQPKDDPALCPECRDGKFRNCVGQALTDDDELVPCGCPNHERSAACAS